MPSIHCDASSGLDFDRVIAAIAKAYSGTRVVQRDWYASRLAEEVAVCDRIGMPVPNAPVESLMRTWAERGLQRGFEVPVRPGLCLYARLDKTGGYFFTDSEFSQTEVKPLV